MFHLSPESEFGARNDVTFDPSFPFFSQKGEMNVSIVVVVVRIVSPYLHRETIYNIVGTTF